jgi:hypothetical protein
MPTDDDANDPWGPDRHTEWRFCYHHDAKPLIPSSDTTWVMDDGTHITTIEPITDDMVIQEPAVITNKPARDADVDAETSRVLEDIRAEQRARMAKAKAKRIADAHLRAQRELPALTRPTKRISIDEYMPIIDATRAPGAEGERETRPIDAVDVAAIMAGSK